MKIKPLLPLLCLLSLFFTQCNDDEDILIISAYNVNCESDCLIIYGAISPVANNPGFATNRLEVTYEMTNVPGIELAYTQISSDAENYRISVPREDIVDYLETLDIGIIGNDVLPYSPQLPFADFTPQTLPDSIEIDLTVVPWAILNLNLENAGDVDEVSYSVLAANGKSESFFVLESFTSLERSLLTYANNELTLTVNYLRNGQQKEKSETLTLPARQDTALTITLD